MDHGQFDDVTRLAAGGPRRKVLRLLARGALGAIAARHGMTEYAAAKPQRRNRKSQAARSRDDDLSTEAKKKGKGKSKGKPKPKPPKTPPLPPGCQSCGQCEMCQDGACVPDRDLDFVFCTESGEPCGYCFAGTCMPSPEDRCNDGSCRPKDGCCPEHYECEDGVCIDPLEMCCLDQRFCGDGICVGEDECCPNAEKPDCGQCSVVCDDGEWVCQPSESAQCPDDQAFNCAAGRCTCKQEALDCGNGTCCPLWEGSGWFCHEGKCCTYFGGSTWLFCQ